ncbi:MAG: hypothetical protein L0Z62_28130 [Gemmataceae bacterium]|nr:hypothetical protein [Gemmataceae bacterium]
MEVVVTPEATAQFWALPKPIQRRVRTIFARLRHWPQVSGAKPLRGSMAGHFRIRTGNYRVPFQVIGARIVVEKIGHRDGFYEE